MALTEMAFSPATGLRDTTTYVTTPASETAAREQIQGRLDEIRDYINDTLLSQLANTTIGTGGSQQIGSPAISGVTGTNVYDQLADIKTQLTAASAASLVAGAIDDTAMFADDVVTGEKIASATIVADNLAADIITGGYIADDAVDSEHIVDGAIDSAHLASGSVTKAKAASDLLAIIPSLNDGTSIPASSNLNNYISTGKYYCRTDVATIVNSPTTDAFELIVGFPLGYSTYIIQTITTFSNAIYTRYSSNGGFTWSAWRHQSNEWIGIVTDQNIGYGAGSVSTTLHVGYSEMLIQLKGATGTSAYVLGSMAVPLQSTGAGVAGPKIICSDSSGNLGTRIVYPTASGINYLTYGLMETQYLSVYVR